MDIFSTSIGAVHTLFAVISLLSGGFVILNVKGNSIHKKVGYLYVISMILTNLTAIFTQSLFVFGPFHFLAVFSLLTVLFGMTWPLFLRENKNWLYWHFQAMSWSYVGLWAAFVSEIAVRLPFVGVGILFGIVVGLSTLLVCIIGGYIIVKHKGQIKRHLLTSDSA